MLNSGVVKRLILCIAALATFSAASAQADELSEETLSRRALLWVKTNEWHETTLRRPQLSCAVLARYKTLLYVECFGLTGPKLLKALASVKGIRGVARDQRVMPVQHSLPSTPFFPKPSAYGDLDNGGVCRLTETCPDGRAKFWGQERMDADLMFGELNRIQLPSGHTKVAVVDSGFDMAQARSQMNESNLTVAPGWDGAGDPNRDEVGHGTAVAGLIGGKDGVGLAPDAKLTVYRVSEANSSGGATSSSLLMSVMKACDEGNEVINLSWGGDFDENAIFEDEQSNKKFYEDLAAKGCLVVKAAGNSARRVQRKHMDPDDALLRVEATEASGQLASFSSNGEVSAPGAGVFTLHSAQASATRPEAVCGGHKGAFISGTSFASPLTAAVATQTLGVLKKNPAFSKLSGPERVATLNRVLAAANAEGGLNALRAVMIADMLRLTPSSLPAADAATLRENFKKRASAFCASTPPVCMNAGNCKASRDCSQSARKHLALCSPVNSNVVKDLLKLSERSQSNEFALSLLGHTSAVSASEASRQTRRIWSRMHEQWAAVGKGDAGIGMSFDQALQLLPSITASRSKVGMESDPDIALASFLSSSQFKSRLSRDLKADSQTDLERVMPVLHNAYVNLKSSDFLKVLEESLAKNTAVESYSKELPLAGVTASGRLLNQMIADPKFAGIKDKLVAMERQLALRASQTGINGRPSEASYFKGLFSRNADLSQAELDKVLKTNDPLDLKKLPLQYLLKNPDAIPDDKRADFNLRVLESYRRELADPKSKSGSEGAAASRQAFDNLKALSKNLPEAEQIALRDRYWKLAEGSENLKQVADAMPHTGFFFSDYSYNSASKDPMTPPDKMHAQSEKIANLMIKDPKQWNEMYESKTGILQKAVPYLIRKEETKALVPVVSRTVVDTLLNNTSVEKWDTLKSFELRTDIEALRYLLGSKDFRAQLKGDPSFLASLEKLRKDMAARESRYSLDAKALTKSLDEFEKAE
jgi:hypothetical protein